MYKSNGIQYAALVAIVIGPLLTVGAVLVILAFGWFGR